MFSIAGIRGLDLNFGCRTMIPIHVIATSVDYTLYPGNSIVSFINAQAVHLLDYSIKPR